jgi:hypothetical protein
MSHVQSQGLQCPQCAICKDSENHVNPLQQFLQIGPIECGFERAPASVGIL